MLVSECIDRTFNNWLYPGGASRPSFDILSSSMTALSPAAGETFTVEQRVTIPPDSILEIGSELILTEASTTGVITVAERGYLDTVSAIHAIGDHVKLDVQFSRKTVLDALVSVIGDLLPQGVYRRVIDETTVTWTTNGSVSLPAGTKRLLKATVRYSNVNPIDYRRLRPDRGEYEVLNEFEPPKIKLVSGGYANAQVIIVIAKDFTLPADETKDLSTDCGVPTTLVPHLPMAVAGMVLQSREVPRVMIEEIRRLLASQGIQVGAAVNVGQLLLNLFAQKVDAERRRLSMLDPVTVEWSD